MALLGSATLALAEPSIDAQISAIKEAPAQERVEMMNQFKQRLSTMNEQERSEAITALRTQMQNRTQTRVHEGEGEMLQTQTRERSRIGQMEQGDQMQRMEQMNQRQGADQFMQQGPRDGSGPMGTQMPKGQMQTPSM